MKSLLAGLLMIMVCGNSSYAQGWGPVVTTQPVIVYQPVVVQPAPVVVYQPVVVQTRIEPVYVWPVMVVEKPSACCWRRWLTEPRYEYQVVPFRY